MINKSEKKNADISFASSDKNSHKTTKQILKFCYQGFNIIFIVYKARSSSHLKGPLCGVSTGIDRLLRLGGGVTTSFFTVTSASSCSDWTCLSRDPIFSMRYLRYLLRRYRNRKAMIIKPAIIMADKAISKASLTEKKL